MPPRPDWVDQAHPIQPRTSLDRYHTIMHERYDGIQHEWIHDSLSPVEPGPVRSRVNLPKLDVALVIVIVAIAAIYFTAHILVAAGVGCGT